jgi:hypothetical protein
MTAAIANLILDIVIVGLLGATVVYCWILNKRIKILQDSKSELAQLLHHFDESTRRASDSIIALQTASKKIGENIQNRIDKANFLLDDLAFMIEKGNKLANQMEASFAVNRARTKVIAEQSAPPAEEAWETEAELPESLQRAARPAAAPAPKKQAEPQQPAGIREKTTASLGAVLERISGRAQRYEMDVEDERPPVMSKPSRPATPANAANDSKPQGERPRSRVEQELLELIRAGVKG